MVYAAIWLRLSPSVVVPSTHMRCRITASLRARATFARFEPLRLATSIPQRLSFENRVMRKRKTLAVFYSAVRHHLIAGQRDPARDILLSTFNTSLA